MGILNLPTEIYLKIPEDLEDLDDFHNLSLAAKKLYVQYNDKCYEIAAKSQFSHHVLAWAIQEPDLFKGPINAARRYLQAGGGSSHVHEWGGRTRTTNWTLHIFDQQEKTVLGYQKDVDKRDFVKLHKRHPDWSTFAEYLDCRTEVCRAIALILKPRSYPTDNLEARLEWLEMILENVHPNILTSRVWRLLICWMCQHFDNESDATDRILDVLKKNFTAGRIPAYGWKFPTKKDMNREGDREDDWHYGQEYNPLGGHTPVHLSHLINSRPSSDAGSEEFWPRYRDNQWQRYYRSECPTTNLFLSLRSKAITQWEPSERMRSFAKRVLDEWRSVENATIWFIIQWTQTLIREGIAQFSCDDLQQLLTPLCDAYSKSNLRPPQDPAYWLGGDMLSFACREDHLCAVEALLKMGPNINAKGPDGRTGLMLTSEHSIFELLLHHPGTDLSILDRHGGSNILASAIARGVALWEARVAPYQPQQMTDENRLNEEKGILEQMRYILQHSSPGVLVTTSDPGGDLPLLLAMGGRLWRFKPWRAGVKLLLEAGADPNIKRHFLKTHREGDQGSWFDHTWMLHRAINHDGSAREDVVDLLLDYGARPDLTDELFRTAYDLPNAKRYPRLAKGTPIVKRRSSRIAAMTSAPSQSAEAAADISHAPNSRSSNTMIDIVMG